MKDPIQLDLDLKTGQMKIKKLDEIEATLSAINVTLGRVARCAETLIEVIEIERGRQR